MAICTKLLGYIETAQLEKAFEQFEKCIKALSDPQKKEEAKTDLVTFRNQHAKNQRTHAIEGLSTLETYHIEERRITSGLLLAARYYFDILSPENSHETSSGSSISHSSLPSDSLFPNDEIRQENALVSLLHAPFGKEATQLTTRLAWSPNGSFLAAAYRFGLIRVWEVKYGETIQFSLFREKKVHEDHILAIAWSPDGTQLASTARNSHLNIWHVKQNRDNSLPGMKNLQVISLQWHDIHGLVAGTRKGAIILNAASSQPTFLEIKPRENDWIACLSISTDGRYLAYGTTNNTHVIKTIDIHTGQSLTTYPHHRKYITDIQWTQRADRILSSSRDHTVRIIDHKKDGDVDIFDFHQGPVNALSLSPEENLLATKSLDGRVLIYDLTNEKVIASLSEKSNENNISECSLAFSPRTGPLGKVYLASLGEGDKGVRIWQISPTDSIKTSVTSTAPKPAFPEPQAKATSSIYQNARVLLAGQGGVGKSALAHVLAGNPYRPMDATHSRSVERLVLPEEIQPSEKAKSILHKEILLWDLAGQNNYRLTHQVLSLHKADIVLLVFDPDKPETFKQLRFWANQIKSLNAGDRSKRKIKQILIAGRTDTSGIKNKDKDIFDFMDAYDIDTFLNTSAKTGFQLKELKEVILQDLDWDKIARHTIYAREEQTQIKQILTAAHDAGNWIFAQKDLIAYIRKQSGQKAWGESFILNQLNALENHDIIIQLKPGNTYLLKPELVDAYADYILRKEVNEKINTFTKEELLASDLNIGPDFKIQHAEHERELIKYTLHKLLSVKLLFMQFIEDEYGNTQESFVSPRGNNSPIEKEEDPPLRMEYYFNGSADHIFTTLLVKLIYLENILQHESQFWKDAAAFVFRGRGRITLYQLAKDQAGRDGIGFSVAEAPSEENIQKIEEIILSHLESEATDIEKIKHTFCPSCNKKISPNLVQDYLTQGIHSMSCPFPNCEGTVILSQEVAVQPHAPVPPLYAQIEKAQKTIKNQNKVQDKLTHAQFDVLFSYKRKNKTQVAEFRKQLEQEGVSCWMDIYQLRGGDIWRKNLEKAMDNVPIMLAFYGSEGVGSYQTREILYYLRIREANNPIKLVPIVMADAHPGDPEWPEVIKEELNEIHFIDFREDEPDPMESLLDVIRYERED